MLSKFKDFLLKNGVKDATAKVYISQLKGGIKLRNTCSQPGWSAVSRWAAKFVLSEESLGSVNGGDGTGALNTQRLLSVVTQKPEIVDPVVIHVFSEDTLDDIENILSMQLDAQDKLKIISTYIQSRQRDLGVKNGTR